MEKTNNEEYKYVEQKLKDSEGTWPEQISHPYVIMGNLLV